MTASGSMLLAIDNEKKEETCFSLVVGQVFLGIVPMQPSLLSKRPVMLGAVTYVIPFLFILYPNMLNPGINAGYIEAAISGIIFVLAFAHLFGGARITGRKYVDIALWVLVSVLASIPSLITLGIAAVAMFITQRLAKRHTAALAL